MDAIHDLIDLPENSSFNHIWSRANRSPDQGDRRLIADRAGYTIRAECHGNIQWHYELPRRISMREAARIQSFPDNFIFDAKLRETERQIGNAVPPVMAWHIAEAVHASLKP
jgi:DNA (cytosine-5)-methyltransferase 1